MRTARLLVNQCRPAVLPLLEPNLCCTSFQQKDASVLATEVPDHVGLIHCGYAVVCVCLCEGILVMLGLIAARFCTICGTHAGRALMLQHQIVEVEVDSSSTSIWA
jgi:hypothetical protein